MAEQLASVPEESTGDFSAPYPPIDSYRESIRSVAWPQWCFRSTLSSQSSQSGSNYSSGSTALSPYLSNNSGYSFGLGSSGPTDLGAGELTKIAHRMVSDGYTQRMVQAFGDGGGQDRALKNWFIELDVDWVLEIPVERQLQFLLQDTSTSWHHELIEKWVRALTIIVISIKKELVSAVLYERSVVAQFAKAGISAMLAFVGAILDLLKVENVQHLLHMYVCVSNASYDMSTTRVHSLMYSETQRIFTEIGGSLVREESRLIQAISTTTMEWMRRNDYDSLWSIGMVRGGGEVHKNTRLMVDYIVLMRKAQASAQHSSQSDNSGTLGDLIDDTIRYLKNLLWKKSELCLDTSLRYLFLLNNSYFIAQMSDPMISVCVELLSAHHQGFDLTPECEQYMDSYLHVSWGHVLSSILKSNSVGQPKHRKKTSLLDKFQSAFHKTYQAQKFWKVPDPRLRSLLRETITKGVISGYRDYLKEHPELEKEVTRGSNSPGIFEGMLGELFEG